MAELFDGVAVHGVGSWGMDDDASELAAIIARRSEKGKSSHPPKISNRRSLPEALAFASARRR